MSAPSLQERLRTLADGWKFLSCDRGGAVSDLRESADELDRLTAELEAARLAKQGFGDAR